MSKKALLGKLKGNRRTFVVHSNTNPYAAVAAMGAAVGRSQALCPYFHFSKKLIPAAEPGDAADAVWALALSNLKVDFMGDWAEFLRQKGMTSCGLKFDQSRTLEENTMRYLNAHRRIPIPTRRVVHESRELSVPQAYEQDYLALKTLMSSGGDLKPYLSRDILKKLSHKNDGLLNAWGIQHLHFRPEGTGHILLCRITDTEVFVIQSLPHDHDVWVHTGTLQILHDNWPKEIAAGKIHGITGEVVPSGKRLALRNQNANFTTTMTDGTVYLAPGGGLMASGECCEDRTNCDKIFSELASWKKMVTSNAAAFRTALSWPLSKELSIKMMFKDRECCLYEPTTGTRISLTLQTDVPRPSLD
jgi:hypothetical protein